MLKQSFHIGEIARFFKIPAATLRFWEDSGILTPQKNKENNYREYSLSDLMKISEIIFYKSLGITLKEITQIEKQDIAFQQNLCQKQMEELEVQQKLLEYRIHKLKNHQKALDEILRLKKRPFEIEPIDTKSIIRFELTESNKLQQYIHNPYLYSRVQKTSSLSDPNRGLTIQEEDRSLYPKEDYLWEYNSTTFVSCLMKEEISQTYPNNLPSLLSKLHKTNATGYIISRYLATATEGEKAYDFYKTFIEILE